MTKASNRFLSIILASILGLNLCPVAARSEDNSKKAQVNAAIDNAFISFKKQKRLSFDPSLENELKRAYQERILNLNPSNFANPTAASHLIDKYSKEDGVKEILSEWLKSTEQSWDEIYSIDEELFMKIYFGSKDPNVHPMFSENMANKYATLVVEPEPNTLKASIYLDGAFVCVTSECPNGVRIASDRVYSLLVRAEGFPHLTKKIVLSKRERKAVKYDPSLLK